MQINIFTGAGNPFLKTTRGNIRLLNSHTRPKSTSGNSSPLHSFFSYVTGCLPACLPAYERARAHAQTHTHPHTPTNTSNTNLLEQNISRYCKIPKTANLIQAENHCLFNNHCDCQREKQLSG